MHEPLEVKTLEKARLEIEEFWEPPRRKKTLNSFKAAGRILAEDLESNLDLPPFDRSAYDGFAVRAEETFGAEEDNPITLENKGSVLAGQNPGEKLLKGECVEIATGAPLPEGANAVVMVEDATISEDGKIEIRRAVSPEKNVSKRGSEIKKGDTVLKSGEVITPQVHGTIFACGIKKVEIFAKPQVGIISTGDEIIEPGSELSPGQIYDINGPALSDAVSNCGGSPTYLGIVRDDRSKIKQKVGEVLNKFDVLITSGGSSAGKSDILPEAIDELGDPGVIFHGLAQKPGKPTLMALIDGNPIFGLPGYPVSALMEFDQLVAPYLIEMAGKQKPKRRETKAELTKKVLPARGRRELIPIRLEKKKGKPLAHPLREGSGAITSLAKADGYTVVPLEKEILDKGEMITVHLFGGGELG